MKPFILILLYPLFANGLSAAEPPYREPLYREPLYREPLYREPLYHVGIEVTSPLPPGNVPMDPTIDYGEIIREQGGQGVLGPNSLEVLNLVTGEPVPFARTEDFAYGDRGRLEWVITDPSHTKYEVRFRASVVRPPLQPHAQPPLIGVGDLLRYNAGQPRPFALQFPARLVDLTGGGKPDLVGCVEWSVYPFYSHNAIEMPRRPSFATRSWTTRAP